jgi:hypothetical protein
MLIGAFTSRNCEIWQEVSGILIFEASLIALSTTVNVKTNL